MIEYTDKYGIKETQEKLLEMMKEIHMFCKEHNIKYSLSGGSCLGAIRHDGFIPWDDDMDIMLDRKNYTILLEELKKWGKYTVEPELWIYRIRENIPDANRALPTIDIFIMDHTPDNVILQKFKIVTLRALQGMLKERVNYENYSMFYRCALGFTHYFGKLFTTKFKLYLYDYISQIGNGKKTKYVTAYNDLFKLLSVKYEGNTMNDLMEHKFEDAFFYVPSQYDSYLTNQYGDYMTLPKESERKPMHT